MNQMNETDSAWKVEGMKTNWLLQEFRFYSFLTRQGNGKAQLTEFLHLIFQL
jgi:hypothetical protein